MFTITNQADYGLIVLSYLSKRKEKTSLKKIIDETKLPPRFVARITSQLVKEKLLISEEGRTGGYLLSPRINSLNLYDYLRAFNKKVKLSKCVESGYDCKFEKICHHQKYLSTTLNRIIIRELKLTKLVNIFN